jgi:hypothetical protein
MGAVVGYDQLITSRTNAPMTQIHPLWGRPFTQYVSSYRLNDTRARVGGTLDFEVEQYYNTREAVYKICKLAGEGKVVDYSNKEDQVTLPMLKSIMRLSLLPNTLPHLGLPALISGCIKLMASVQCSGKSSVSTLP